MAMVNIFGPCCVVSDFGNNAGLLVGPSIPNWDTQSPASLSATRDRLMMSSSVPRLPKQLAVDLCRCLRYLIQLCGERGLALVEGYVHFLRCRYRHSRGNDQVKGIG